MRPIRHGLFIMSTDSKWLFKLRCMKVKDIRPVFFDISILTQMMKEMVTM